MKWKLIATTVILAILTAVLTVLYQLLDSQILLSSAITAGTFCYHFAMRLTVGCLLDFIFHGRMDFRKRWFRPQPWEPKLYRVMRVRSWKGKMPTFFPDRYDLRRHSPEEIMQTMCHAEAGHELEAVLSFVPLIASKWFGAFPVFLITSLLAAAFDLMLAAVQRFNRPRLIKFISRRKC